MSVQLTTGTPIALLIENVDARGKRLFGDSRQVPSRPRRLHLLGEIWSAGTIAAAAGNRRAKRRRAWLRARSRGRCLNAVFRRRACPRRAGADGPQRITREHWDWDEVRAQSRSSAPDASTVDALGALSRRHCARTVRPAAPSIEVVAEGVPAGLGAPIYGKLDAEIAAALMSINAVKGVEIGDGFAAAELVRRRQFGRDAQREQTASPTFFPTTRAEFSAAFRAGSRSSRDSP